MNKVMNITLFLTMTYMGFVLCSSDRLQDVDYRIAQQDDSQQLLEIINTQAIHDSHNIVVLPKRFREAALQKNIADKKLFVAYLKSTNEIVGYKKLFVMADQEKEQTLRDEIRCLGGVLAKQGEYTASKHSIEYAQDGVGFVYNADDTIVYNGADFTRRELRGLGVNSNLMHAALALVKPEIKDSVARHASQKVVMVYGVTEENESRTPSIARSFSQFCKHDRVHLAAYDAYKPSFDPDSPECVPLPDEHSVKGFGYALSCPVTDNALEVLS